MKLDLKPIVDALNLIGRITGTENIGMALSKKVLRITGENSGRALQVKLPLAEAAKWEFSIPKEKLDQVFKGRKELEMRVEDDGSRLFFNAKTYRAEFSTQPYGSAPELERSKAIEVTDAQQQHLQESLDYLSLAPIHEGDTHFCVDFNKKHVEAACFDQMHFAYLSTSGIPGSLKLSLPTAAFSVIADAVKKKKYGMSTTSASICVWNDDIELILPFFQQEVAQTVQDVKNMAETFGRGWAQLEAKPLIAAIQSAQSAVDDGEGVTLTVKDNVIFVTGSSSIGKVTEKLACKSKTKGEMFLNPAVALSLLSQVPEGIIEIGAHDDRFLFIRAQVDEVKLVYGGMLFEKEEKD